MKRFYDTIICAMLFILVVHVASAEIPCDCGEEKCICFIQLGDEGIAVKGIIGYLYEEGYLRSSKGSTYDDDVYNAVCRFQADHDLMQTGMMDDHTLTLLISGAHAAVEDEAYEVWVATDGGKKRHSKPTCSGMYDPRKMSAQNAEALGIEACKRCKPQ